MPASDSAAGAPVLDLSTLIAERPPIRIDGVTYHLKSPDELTLAESHEFGRWGRQLEELGQADDRLDEVETLLHVVSRAILADVPQEVFARLAPSQKMSIVEVFTALLLGHKARLVGAVTRAGLSIGQRPSRASSAPMAATPDGGSTAPPRRSSVPT